MRLKSPAQPAYYGLYSISLFRPEHKFYTSAYASILLNFGNVSEVIFQRNAALSIAWKSAHLLESYYRQIWTLRHCVKDCVIVCIVDRSSSERAKNPRRVACSGWQKLCIKVFYSQLGAVCAGGNEQTYAVAHGEFRRGESNSAVPYNPAFYAVPE